MADLIERQAREIDMLKAELIAPLVLHAVKYAESVGLPSGSLHPKHYDRLAALGGRMVDFTRADVSGLGETRGQK